MAWNDRVREASYTAPDGTRIVFDYEDVSRSVDKKTAAYEFPDAEGTYVQDLGRSGRQYPMRVFFWGPEYDTAAAAFESALLQRGTGRLEHPMYGVAQVVPFGTIKRRDDLKTAANQAVVELTFWDTISTAYPSSQNDPGSEVLTAVSEFSTASSEEISEALDLDAAIERVTFKNTYRGLLDSAAAGLAAIAEAEAAAERQFNIILESINLGIDALIADPLSLAFQTTQLIQSPARSVAAIEDRLSAYRDLTLAVISGSGASTGAGRDGREANAFRARELFASAYVTGSIVSVVNHRFGTKTDALAAAEAVLDQFNTVNAWRDDSYASLGIVDTGAAYQRLQEAVALTAGFLVFISFSLKQEKTIVLDRARTIIDLVAELYGTVDDQIDFFIQSNRLTGSEILELPRGRSCVYYI